MHLAWGVETGKTVGVPQHNEDIAKLAKEIGRYLAAHPNAADSLEGVVKWWLTRMRYEESWEQVRRALEMLVGQGSVTTHPGRDGKIIYSRGKSANETQK